MPEYNPDALALASMIADYLRGTPIDVEDLPPSAWLLVAGYVAQHDYGTTTATGTTGATFMGNPVRARFQTRGPGGESLPVLPRIHRGRHRVIDAEAVPDTRGLPAVTPLGGTVVK